MALSLSAEDPRGPRRGAKGSRGFFLLRCCAPIEGPCTTMKQEVSKRARSLVHPRDPKEMNFEASTRIKRMNTLYGPCTRETATSDNYKGREQERRSFTPIDVKVGHPDVEADVPVPVVHATAAAAPRAAAVVVVHCPGLVADRGPHRLG